METEKSLVWWRSLSEPTKKYLAEKHIPNRNYVTMADINKMYQNFLQLQNCLI